MPVKGRCFVENVDQSIALQKYLLDCGFSWQVMQFHPDTDYDIRSFDKLVVAWNEKGITADFISTALFHEWQKKELVEFEDYFEIRPGYEGWETGLQYGI